VVFLSRVSRKKNLAHALALVSRLRCPATLEIFGPVEDRRYWAACQRAMQHLPVHVRAEYRGEVPHDRVAEVFARHDVFLFPTLGESYGHVIQESLLAGCPVLTSDQTPWTGLDAHGAGWALPLEREQAFVDALERCAAMDATERLALRTRARAFGRQSADPEEPTVQHRRLFDAAARSRR
jgi:glycosyltransferase involved in cell wall biosynthesis